MGIVIINFYNIGINLLYDSHRIIDDFLIRERHVNKIVVGLKGILL